MSRFWGGVALTGYFGLFGVLLLWYAWLEPSSRLPTALVLILLVGPLLMPLRGLLHGRPYTMPGPASLRCFILRSGFSMLPDPWFILGWLGSKSDLAYCCFWARFCTSAPVPWSGERRSTSRSLFRRSCCSTRGGVPPRMESRSDEPHGLTWSIWLVKIRSIMLV